MGVPRNALEAGERHHLTPERSESRRDEMEWIQQSDTERPGAHGPTAEGTLYWECTERHGVTRRTVEGTLYWE